jgi:hypothetical protein
VTAKARETAMGRPMSLMVRPDLNNTDRPTDLN